MGWIKKLEDQAREEIRKEDEDAKQAEARKQSEERRNLHEFRQMTDPLIQALSPVLAELREAGFDIEGPVEGLYLKTQHSRYWPARLVRGDDPPVSHEYLAYSARWIIHLDELELRDCDLHVVLTEREPKRARFVLRDSSGDTPDELRNALAPIIKGYFRIQEKRRSSPRN